MSIIRLCSKMGNNAAVCPWLRSRSKCVLNILLEMVKKFQFCHEQVGCNIVGGFYGSYVMLLCSRDCCIMCSLN